MIGEPEPVELHVDGDRVSFVRYLMQQETSEYSALQFVQSRKAHRSVFCSFQRRKGTFVAICATVARFA